MVDYRENPEASKPWAQHYTDCRIAAQFQQHRKGVERLADEKGIQSGRLKKM